MQPSQRVHGGAEDQSSETACTAHNGASRHAEGGSTTRGVDEEIAALARRVPGCVAAALVDVATGEPVASWTDSAAAAESAIALETARDLFVSITGADREVAAAEQIVISSPRLVIVIERTHAAAERLRVIVARAAEGIHTIVTMTERPELGTAEPA